MSVKFRPSAPIWGDDESHPNGEPSKTAESRYTNPLPTVNKCPTLGSLNQTKTTEFEWKSRL